MANHTSCTWTGASGRKYIYDVYARHPELTPNEPGNYIYAKMDQHHGWVPIYIGAGDLTQRAAMDPRVGGCITTKGATHVHVHVNHDRDKRLAEARDLLSNYPQTRIPNGCNEEP